MITSLHFTSLHYRLLKVTGDEPLPLTSLSRQTVICNPHWTCIGVVLNSCVWGEARGGRGFGVHDSDSHSDDACHTNRPLVRVSSSRAWAKRSVLQASYSARL
jgi:hypothetical protein